MRRLVAAACFFVIAASTIGAFVATAGCLNRPRTATASTTAKVDALFAEWDRTDSPGCSLGVSQNGVVVYERGYGTANVELGRPITPASVFHVASVSKQFTAMSIVLLAQRGQLSLDDEARKFITELPDYGDPLTIRHLLTHTGGLRDEFLLRELTAPRDEHGDPNDALVSLLAHQRALNFSPGAEYQYSNAGYTLLATIVKRVSRQSLRAFADRNIFKPLAMTHTHVHDDPSMIVPDRASGYSRGSDGFRVAVRADPGGIVGNTGLFTTARDLLLWEQNFANVGVGDPARLAAMQAPTVLTGGETSPYGFGLQVGQHRGLRTVGHGGNDTGYSAEVVRYPDQGLAVAVLCNLDSIDSVRLSRDVAEVYLADVFPVASAASRDSSPRSVALSTEQLTSKAGLYRDPSTEFLLRLSVRDGKLRGSSGAGDDAGWEVVPVNANRFVIRGSTIALEFVPTVIGPAQEMHVLGERPKPEVFQRLNEFAVSSQDLRAFAGEYSSPDLEATYTLAVRDSGLLIQIPGRKEIPLRALFQDGFAGDLVGVVKFTRGARGLVSTFTLNGPGVRRLQFDRVK